MNRYFKKLGLFAFGAAVVGLSLTPVQAQESSQGGSYRYVNPECEFSYQLPEAPSSDVLWAEARSPLSFMRNPGIGEFGEKSSFQQSDFAENSFFEVNAYCFFLSQADIEQITVGILRDELDRYIDRNGLKNSQINSQQGESGLRRAQASGFFIEDEEVTAVHVELLRGTRSLMFFEISYSAEGMENRELLDEITSSIVYDTLY